MIKFRYILVALLVCGMMLPAIVRSDYLVWKSGAKMKIRKDYDLLNRDNKIMRVTLIGPSGKDVKVYIRPEDVDWNKTEHLNRADIKVDTDFPEKPDSVDVEKLGKGKSEKPEPGPKPTSEQKGDIVLQDKYAHNQYGHIVVGGTILNKTSKTLNSIDVRVDFFNNAGDKMETLNRKLSDLVLKPGNSHSFEFLKVSQGMDEKFKEYEIKLKWEE